MRLWHWCLFFLCAFVCVCLHIVLGSKTPLFLSCLLFLPYGVLSLLEWLLIHRKSGSFLFIRLLSSLFGMSFVIIAFFAFRAFSPHDSFIADTLFLIGGCAAEALLSYYLS